MNVSDKFTQVCLFLAEYRLVTVLEQMSMTVAVGVDPVFSGK